MGFDTHMISGTVPALLPDSVIATTAPNRT